MCPGKKKNKTKHTESCSSDSHQNMTEIPRTETRQWYGGSRRLIDFSAASKRRFLGPSPAKFRGGAAFSWHMLWHPRSWASCQHTTPVKTRVNYRGAWIRRNSFKGIIQNRQIQSFGKSWSVCVYVYVCVCVCVCVVFLHFYRHFLTFCLSLCFVCFLYLIALKKDSIFYPGSLENTFLLSFFNSIMF